MADELVQMGRVAFRTEGNMWNAYYALPDTMEGATYLGSIAMAAIRNNRARKEEFIQMMRSIVGEIIEQRIGQKPTWGEQENAPEHEKAGHS